jgi:glycosyltransferase 2 family protein
MSSVSAPPPDHLIHAEAVPQTPSRAWRFLVLKLIVTVALLTYLFTKVDARDFSAKFSTIAIMPVALAVLIVVAEIPLVAARWMLIARQAGARMSFRLALQLTWTGLFFGQVLPASIGGDVVRGVLAARNGLAWPPVVSSLVVDRLIALLAAVMMIAIALLFLQAEADSQLRSTGQLSIAVVLILIAGLFADRFPIPRVVRVHALVAKVIGLIQTMRAALLSRVGALAVGISMLVHVMTIAAVASIAVGLGVPNALLACAIVTPIALVAAAVPISVNGWGVREGVMVAGFAVFGIVEADAFLISVLLGLSVVVSSLPGGLSWLTLR